MDQNTTNQTLAFMKYTYNSIKRNDVLKTQIKQFIEKTGGEGCFDSVPIITNEEVGQFLADMPNGKYN